MKKLFFGAMVALFCAGAVQAQTKTNSEQKSAEQVAKHQTEQMTKSLNLDDATSKKVHDINLKYAKKRSETGNLKAERQKELKKVLSAKEYEAYEKGAKGKCQKEKTKKATKSSKANKTKKRNHNK